jgi:hypothetical protein
MSTTAASSMSAAACLPFSITLAVVTRIAWPLRVEGARAAGAAAEGSVSLSPWRMRILSIGTPSSWLVSMA